MASYKQPCIHCGALIDRDSRFCPQCASHSPFGYSCPNCMHAVDKSQRVCPACGQALYIACTACGKLTFIGEPCAYCGANLSV